jgi:hypothetical protein
VQKNKSIALKAKKTLLKGAAKPFAKKIRRNILQKGICAKKNRRPSAEGRKKIPL